MKYVLSVTAKSLPLSIRKNNTLSQTTKLIYIKFYDIINIENKKFSIWGCSRIGIGNKLKPYDLWVQVPSTLPIVCFYLFYFPFTERQINNHGSIWRIMVLWWNAYTRNLKFLALSIRVRVPLGPPIALRAMIINQPPPPIIRCRNVG